VALTDRTAGLLLAGIAAAGIAATAVARVPAFWGDSATYHAMAWSLAEDGDLEYEARDVFRVRREYPSGPQGIFLKRASGGYTFGGGAPRRVPPDEPRIYFAKAFVHPVIAAPFVKLMGSRGLLVTNALALSIALALAYRELRRAATPGRALLAATVLLLATVAPVYLVWPTPELVTLALVMGGLSAWRSGRPLLAAVLLGIATYTKPYNLFLALPLGVEPLLALRPWWKGLGESARRGAAMAATVVALFAVNAAITGELNYQGGERKTFYGRFPFEMDGEREITFGNSGIWMTTNQPGPLVEGRDDHLVTRRTGPARPAGEVEASFRRNLYYFWIGRFGGALAYFFPALLALAVFVLFGPRSRHGYLALAALGVSFLFYIWMIPDNWYGGGGTLGNRYFLNLLPLAILLIPPGREVVVAIAGAAVSAASLWPMWIAPIHHSLRPGDHATVQPFRSLPPELTMLNDLAVFTELWRKKQSYGDTEGDAHKNWPADPKAYYLYFTDNGTYGREERDGVPGFWLRGGEPAEVVLRALEPVKRVTVRVVGGPAGDDISLRIGRDEQRFQLAPGQAGEATFTPGPGFPYYDTFVHVVRMRSRRGAPGADGRTLGSFVFIALETNRRPRP
jgi:hypothetical protein